MNGWNKLVYGVRLLFAVLYTGFIGFHFALFCILGADASEQEVVSFLTFDASVAFVVLLMLFPPRLISRHYFFVLLFILLNLLAAIFPMAINSLFSFYEESKVKYEFQVMFWVTFMMLIPTFFLLCYLCMNRNSNDKVMKKVHL